MSEVVAVILGCAAGSAAVRAAGPVVFGGRRMSSTFTALVTALSPALLAALVITQAGADGTALAAGADTAGVAAGGVAALVTRSPVVAVVCAAAVTAVLRASGALA